ncbi:MAG: AMP-binding protein, partial [Acidobacteria bacterium]|nr:AMP-binding protein [Acidobacteriota bacterium]
MMDRPLLISDLLRFARRNHGGVELVSAMADGSVHRTTYGEAYGRVCQLGHALRRLGVEPGDRVATLAWNDYRHFEIYFAVSG